MPKDPESHTAPPTPEIQQDQIHLLIVGGGLCGLAAAIATSLAGHRVTLLEAVSSLREVGAGLQLTPNGTRLLQTWGLTDRLEAQAALPDYLCMRRYDGRVLASRTDYVAEVQGRYGSPLWCLHRADLQQAMAARAVELGADIRLGAKVVRVDAERACVHLEGGAVIEADIVLGADGLWSTSRDVILDVPIRPAPTGNLAYRILLDRENLNSLELSKWLETPGINIWMGPGAHVVAYSIKGGRWLNLVLLVPDDLPENVRKAEGDLNEMMKLFEGWDPRLTQILQHTSSVEKWKLSYLSPLPQWKTQSGSFVIAGDCAHAMLPYMAQGANSSLEDGATIGALLSKVHRKEQIPAAMDIYDAIRRARVDQLVRETFVQGREHHLPDGEEQVKRDVLLGQSMAVQEELDGKKPWTHPKIQPWIWGYNAYDVVEQAYQINPF